MLTFTLAAAFCVLTKLVPAGLIASTVSDLRARLLSADGKNDEPIAVSRTVPLPQGVNPNYLVFASNESKLLVGLAEGAIIVYDANAICSAGTENIIPIHTFLATTSTSARHIYPNPGDLPDLVAVLREPDGNPNTQLVEILDVTALQSVAGWRSGGTPQTLPMSSALIPDLCIRIFADILFSIVVAEGKTDCNWYAKRRYHDVQPDRSEST